MTDDHITAIVVAMLTNRYVIPESDNEKMAKEVARIYRVLKEKTISDKYRGGDESDE